MRNEKLQSWGRYPRASQAWRDIQSADDPLPSVAGPLLPRGLGRSYGDTCLNDGGTLLLTRPLRQIVGFDPSAGILCAESGGSLGELASALVPAGWFLPVVPGTRFVTLGGAVASDIHGKNHHRVGTFGRHVRSIDLLRSDGRRIHCTPDENADWLRATVGGLGLTGLITRVEIQLVPIRSPAIRSTSTPFHGLREFAALSAEADASSQYVVSWVDALAHEPRGIMFSGDHTDDPSVAAPRMRWSVPFDCPPWLVSAPVVRLFNSLYAAAQARRSRPHNVHYLSFFFPLDAVTNWNRLYGRAGLVQWQGVLAGDAPLDAVAEILRRVAAAGTASPLAVLKSMGDSGAPGILSFSRKGVTLALDFPFRGGQTLRLLDELDDILIESGGALYPAKDARMSPQTFRSSFPRWRDLRDYVDPAISSSFWRRVGGDDHP